MTDDTRELVARLADVACILCVNAKIAVSTAGTNDHWRDGSDECEDIARLARASTPPSAPAESPSSAESLKKETRADAVPVGATVSVGTRMYHWGDYAPEEGYPTWVSVEGRTGGRETESLTALYLAQQEVKALRDVGAGDADVTAVRRALVRGCGPADTINGIDSFDRLARRLADAKRERKEAWEFAGRNMRMAQQAATEASVAEHKLATAEALLTTCRELRQRATAYFDSPEKDTTLDRIQEALGIVSDLAALAPAQEGG